MIILIGGGEIADGETLHIDKKFIALAGGDQATIAFFPTAADDDEQYVEGFSAYMQKLGCKEVVPIYLSKLNNSEIHSLLENVTGIYFGGGNTQMLIDACNRSNLKKILLELHEKGVIIAGISAGALAMCDYFIDPDSTSDCIISGLGIQSSLLAIVHYEGNRDQGTIEKLKALNPDPFAS